jgi:hypothetical protein
MFYIILYYYTYVIIHILLISLTKAMEKLGTHLEGRLIELHRLKDEGVKIIGYTPGEYMPE